MKQCLQVCTPDDFPDVGMNVTGAHSKNKCMMYPPPKNLQAEARMRVSSFL